MAIALTWGAEGREWMDRLAALSIAATLGTLVGGWRLRASPFWRRVRPWWFRPLPAPPRVPRR